MEELVRKYKDKYGEYKEIIKEKYEAEKQVYDTMFLAMALGFIVPLALIILYNLMVQ